MPVELLSLAPASLLLLVLLLTYLMIKRGLYSKPNNLPPSPSNLPLIGNLHQLISSFPLHRTLHNLSLKHGPLMLLHLGTVRTLVVSSSIAAQEVLKTQDHIFASRPPLSAAKYLLYNNQDMVFAPYGEYWRQAKKLCIVHLLSGKRVQQFQGLREEEVGAMVREIRAKSRLGPVNLSVILNSLANNVVTRAALGKRCNSSYEEGGKNEFCEMVEEMSKFFVEFNLEDNFPYMGWMAGLSGLRRRMRNCFRKVDRFLDGVVEECLKGGGDECFVSELVSLAKNDGFGRVGITLSRDNIKAIILNMFAAGTDTSFITLEWTMSELLRNPMAMSKLEQELRTTVSDIDHLPYLDAVIKESLRLHPAAPLLLPHYTTQQTQLLGHTVPRNTTVLVNFWTIGRDPENWEEPEAFKPERFVGSEVDYKGQDFRFVPFGSGRRVCPGIAFSVSTVKLALAKLVTEFEWEVEGGGGEIDMEEMAGLTARRNTPLVLVAKPING